MLAYLANTLIFIIVGVVITEQASTSVTGNDIMLNISLYCAITVIRYQQPASRRREALN